MKIFTSLIVLDGKLKSIEIHSRKLNLDWSTGVRIVKREGKKDEMKSANKNQVENERWELLYIERCFYYL